MKLCEEAKIGDSKWFPSVSIVSLLLELTLTRDVAPPSNVLGFAILSILMYSVFLHSLVEASWYKIKGICDQFSAITEAYIVTAKT
jgi:hypothetical protein